MDTQTSATQPQTGAAHADWHPADVKAALEKRGVSLRALAKQYGYSHIQRVLTSQWWAAEQIVAKALGLQAQHIWPSRYSTATRRGQRMTRNAQALALAKPAKAAKTTKSARKSAVEHQAA